MNAHPIPALTRRDRLAFVAVLILAGVAEGVLYPTRLLRRWRA